MVFFHAVHDSFFISYMISAERVIKVNFKRFSSCKTRIDIDNQGFSLAVNRINTSRIKKNSSFLVIWYPRCYFRTCQCDICDIQIFIQMSPSIQRVFLQFSSVKQRLIFQFNQSSQRKHSIKKGVLKKFSKFRTTLFDVALVSLLLTLNIFHTLL